MKLEIRSAKESDGYKDIARIPEGHRKDVNGNPIPSGNICKLTINGKSKYLILRGHDNETGPVLFLDESCREKLGVRPDNEKDVEVDVAIHRATCWISEKWSNFRWAWEATDPSYRLPVQISVISLVLGLFGVALGIISLL